MSGLTKPLSVRLADEDALFLAGLEIEEATTSSDKVRALIREARRRAETPTGYASATALSHDLLAPARQAIRQAEAEAEVSSEVLNGLLLGVEEMLALALTAPADAKADPEHLAQFESKLVDRAIRLTERLLRWGVTPEAPAYDRAVITKRLQSLRDLMKLINAAPSAANERS